MILSKLERLFRYIDTLSNWSGKIVSYLLLVMISVMIFEMVMRFILNMPTIWIHELTGYLFGTQVIIGGGFALLLGKHVSVDILYSRLSPRKKAVLDVITAFFFFLFCITLLWQTGKAGYVATLRQEYSNTVWGPPLWPIKLVVPLGVTLLLFQGIAKFIRDLIVAITNSSIAELVTRGGKEGI